MTPVCALGPYSCILGPGAGHPSVPVCHQLGTGSDRQHPGGQGHAHNDLCCPAGGAALAHAPQLRSWDSAYQPQVRASRPPPGPALGACAERKGSALVARALWCTARPNSRNRALRQVAGPCAHRHPERGVPWHMPRAKWVLWAVHCRHPVGGLLRAAMEFVGGLVPSHLALSASQGDTRQVRMVHSDKCTVRVARAKE